mgnify:CR=1 FL=1
MCIKELTCCHNKLKRTCRVCNPTAFCLHEILKYSCKICVAARTCQHNMLKIGCKICSIHLCCEHDKFKRDCKICSNHLCCEHDNFERYCKICNPKIIDKEKFKKKNTCEHGKIKYECVFCKPRLLCIHDKFKKYCIICNKNLICIHNKRKYECKKCSKANSLCKSSFCETRKNKKYDDYCLFCYVNLFPDKEIVRNYKTKEKHVVDKIKEKFPNFAWIEDKKIQDGCSRRRPDLMCDFGTHIVILEIDENAHSNYDCSCENKRLMEISKDLNHRPIIFIRFNPDGYTNKEGEKIKSCWRANKNTGILQINQRKITEWNNRIKSLEDQIDYWTKNKTDKTIEIIELYYDQNLKIEN